MVGGIACSETSVDPFELFNTIDPLEAQERMDLLREKRELERAMVKRFAESAPRYELASLLSVGESDEVSLPETDDSRLAETLVLASKQSQHALSAFCRGISSITRKRATPDEQLLGWSSRISAIRNRVFADSLRLASQVAKKRGRLSWGQALATASSGLIEGIDRFDVDQGTQFSTYATWWLNHRLSRARAEHANALRLPVYANEILYGFRRAENDLTVGMKRPSPEQVLAKAGLPSDVQISDWRRPVLRISNGSTGVSLELILETELPSPWDGGLADGWVRELSNWLHAAIEKAESTQRRILQSRLALGIQKEETLLEIGVRFNVSRERIRQVQNIALTKLASECGSRITAPWGVGRL